MTKEQLIELINQKIPDGELVNFRTTKDHIFNVVGVDDDSCVGLWNIIISEIPEDEHAFDSALEDAFEWRDKGGLKSRINWE